jgi:predicted acetyltransferase
MKDLAEFRNFAVQADGRYRDDRLRTYLVYEEHWPLLIRNQGKIVGFALVRKSKPETYLIGEFFIKPEFRRSCVGAAAVAKILREFSGDWEIPFQNENAKAAAFWRQTITKLGYQATEISSPVIGRPELPTEVLLIFSS